MGSAIELKLFSGIHLLLEVFRFEAFVNCIVGKSLRTKVQVGVILTRNIFIGFYWQLTAT